MPSSSAQAASLFFSNGDSVKVADSDSLDLTADFTIEAWVRPTADIVLDFFNFVVSKQLNGTGYTLLAAGTSYQFESFNFSPGPTFDARTSGPLFIENWVHLAAVRSGNLNQIYVNGVLTAINAVPLPTVANDQDLYIGGSVFGDDTSWNGYIDEVRIWNDARSAREISDNRFLSFTAPQENLVGNWRFDEGAGLTAFDSSGFENHGVLDPPEWSTTQFAPVTASAVQAVIPLPPGLLLFVTSWLSVFALLRRVPLARLARAACWRKAVCRQQIA